MLEKIIKVIEKGSRTNVQIANELGLSTAKVRYYTAELVTLGKLSKTFRKDRYFYDIKKEYIAHDPFGLSRLCRTSSPDQGASQRILQGTTSTGFGYRQRHFLEDCERSDFVKHGNGSRSTGKKSRQKEMR